MTRLTAWLIGLLMGSVTVWLLVLGWINRERDRAADVARQAEVAHAQESARWAEYRRQQDESQRRDSLERVEWQRRAAEHQAATVRQSRIVAQLREQLDTLRSSVDSLPVFVQIVAQQDTTIHHLSAQATHLGTALQAEIRRSAALTLSLAAADSGLVAASRRIQVLEGLVRTPPDVPRGRLFGFLPRPTCGVGAAITVGPSEGITPRPAVACVVGL